MLDRLVSGAGAVTDLADRFARVFTRRAGGDLLGDRPGSAVVAVLLVGLAAVLAVVGLEAAVDPELRERRPADLATAADLGGGAYSTMTGGVAVSYVENFFDDNANGTQEDGEAGTSWLYFLVDPATRSGVTVSSDRPPSAIFRAAASGTVRDDPATIATDAELLADELEELGIRLDPTRLIDATVAPSGPTQAVALGSDLPPDGTAVTVSGPRSGTWIPVCMGDADADGDCSDDEVDAYDVVIYDEASGRGVLVLLEESPEFAPATFAGMLRRDERAVSGAKTTPDLGFEGLDIAISDHFLLDDGAMPPNTQVVFAVATGAGLGAALILIGLAGGYLVFRRAEGSPPGPATTMAPGDRIPLRVTGRLRTPTGDLHVREVPADLVRFETSVADGSTAPPTSTLIVERTGRPEGVEVGLGRLSRLTIGRVIPFGGPRPAVRAVAGTGPLLLSFDDAAARDRAAAELLDETGLGAEEA
jgi:hypothetical protein